MKKLYFGGPIHTMEPGVEPPYAILTEKGTITALLTQAEARQITDARAAGAILLNLMSKAAETQMPHAHPAFFKLFVRFGSLSLRLCFKYTTM